MLTIEHPLDHEFPPADQSLPMTIYVADGREYPDVGTVLPGPNRNEFARLFSSSYDLLVAARATLAMLEGEGRDTGMGGPLSDLRDAVAKVEGRE
jgi:hypothetical protein